MTFAQGLFFGIFGFLFTIVGFMIAWIIYETNQKKIRETEENKERDIFNG